MQNFLTRSVLVGRSTWQHNNNHHLNHQSTNKASNQWRGGGVRWKYKWAFNDAVEPSETEGEERTIIKHLISLVWFCCCHPSHYAFTRVSSSLSSSKKKSLRSPFLLPSSSPPVLLFFARPVSCPLCVKNKGRCPVGDEKEAVGQRDIWMWYFLCQHKCLVSTNSSPGNQRERATRQYGPATKNNDSREKKK